MASCHVTVARAMQKPRPPWQRAGRIFKVDVKISIFLSLCTSQTSRSYELVN